MINYTDQPVNGTMENEIQFLKQMLNHGWTEDQMRYEIRKRINKSVS